jgi:hypothetical protein
MLHSGVIGHQYFSHNASILSSKTLVSYPITTWCYNTEDHDLDLHHFKNPVSHNKVKELYKMTDLTIHRHCHETRSVLIPGIVGSFQLFLKNNFLAEVVRKLNALDEIAGGIFHLDCPTPG